MRELVVASMLMEGDCIRNSGQWFTVNKIETYTTENLNRRFVLSGTYDDGGEGIVTLMHNDTVYLGKAPRITRTASIDWQARNWT